MLLAGVAAGLIPTMARWRWTSNTAALAGTLQTFPPAESRMFTADSLSELPPPVARYLRHVLRAGQRRIVRADVIQDAEFWINGAWKPLHATQRFAIDPPGFVWDARIAMTPLLSAYVRDAYVNGEGSMQATLLGLYTLTHQNGRSELDASALQRYLAEALWFPTAFLPGSGITWAPLTDRAAIATVTDGETSVSLEFRFNDRDEVAEVVGPRFAEQQGAYELRPWQVLCGSYQAQSGMLIPAFCEVAWQMPDGRLPYWRGRVVQIEYELAQ
jgi:hypothetical protein